MTWEPVGPEKNCGVVMAYQLNMSLAIILLTDREQVAPIKYTFGIFWYILLVILVLCWSLKNLEMMKR